MTNDTNVSELAVADIKVDPECQARAASNDATINEYAKIMGKGNGNTFPPVVVFHDGTDYWLSDGFHRYEAAKKAGLVSLKSRIRQGTRRDAILNSVGANASHGLRRTNADKRRAVSILLHDEEWSTWSNREVARRCGVDEGLVRKVQDELGSSAPVSADNPQIARKVERKGTRYQMKTDNKIGKKDGRAERLPLQSDPNDQPEQVWGHTRQPAETDANAAELSDDEPVSSSEQSCSSDKAQLRELMFAWARASEEVRQQFLARVGASLSPVGSALSNPASSEDKPPEPEAGQQLESPTLNAAEPSAAEQQENPLVEEWNGLRGHSRAYGRMWIEAGCPDEYHPSENPYITEKLVPFRAAAKATTREQREQFLELTQAA
jgi:ParB-like chromosome segregation protein Spo0J